MYKHPYRPGDGSSSAEQVGAACCNLCADGYLKTDVLNSGLFLCTEIQHQALTWNNVYSGAAPSVDFGSGSSPLELCCLEVMVKEP